jgi:hypothetical protein
MLNKNDADSMRPKLSEESSGLCFQSHHLHQPLQQMEEGIGC